MILRAAMLASGTGFILTPRQWLARMREQLLRRLGRLQTGSVGREATQRT